MFGSKVVDGQVNRAFFLGPVATSGNFFKHPDKRVDETLKFGRPRQLLAGEGQVNYAPATVNIGGWTRAHNSLVCSLRPQCNERGSGNSHWACSALS